MGKKIDKIFNSKSPETRKQNTVYARSLEKAKAKSEKEKWKIFKIAQDNQSMLKRLHDAQTSYDHIKYQNDYKKSLYYKKRICEFPEVESNLKNSTVENFYSNYTTYGNFNNNYKNNTSNNAYSKTSNNFYNSNNNKNTKLKKLDLPAYNKTQQNNYNNNTEKLSNKKGVVSLYFKSFFFQDLLQCRVSFYLESKKFVIKVKTCDTEEEDCYYLIFEGAEEIMKMKSVYKSYDDIVNDLDHNVHSDLVLIKNPLFSSFYVSINKFTILTNVLIL